MKKKIKETNQELETRRQNELDTYIKEKSKQGYKHKEILIQKENLDNFAVLTIIPIFEIFLLIYLKVNHDFIPLYDRTIDWENLFITSIILLFVCWIVLTIIHEYIHGVIYGLFSPNKFKDIEFGFNAKHITPYCLGKTATNKIQYVLSASAPCILLGIIPITIAIVFENIFLFFVALGMILGAFGDIYLVCEILRCKHKKALYLPHPIKTGFVVFYKDDIVEGNKNE